jgi:hypothetical protein
VNAKAQAGSGHEAVGRSRPLPPNDEQQKGNVIRRRAGHRNQGGHHHARGSEKTRVRPDPCDLCCIVQPTLRRATTPSNRRRWSPRRSSDRRGRPDEDIPGRVSCVRFTSHAVKRSSAPRVGARPSGCARPRGATGVSEVAEARVLDEKTTLVRGTHRTTEAREGIVKRPLPAAEFPRKGCSEQRNRPDQGARLIREMGRIRSYASVVRRPQVSDAARRARHGRRA